MSLDYADGFGHIRANLPQPVGAQASIVPDHVRHCLGPGFRSGNKRELAEFGKDIMFIFPGRAPAVKGVMNSARSYLLTYQDYLEIRTQAPHVRNACPLLSRPARGERI